MTLRAEKRRGYRISIRLEVIGTSGRSEVVGVLTNISYSGALIEDTSELGDDDDVSEAVAGAAEGDDEER